MMQNTNTPAAPDRRYLWGPLWRVRIALELPSGLPGRQRNQDPLILRYHRFRQLLGEEITVDEEERCQYRTFYAAEQLNEEVVRTNQIKLALLARLPRDEIAQRVAVHPEVLDLWQSLFFDIEGTHNASDWLYAYVVAPVITAGELELATHMKAAIGGGPIVGRAILDMIAMIPGTDAEREAHRQLKLYLKGEAALDYPLSDNTALKLVRVTCNEKARSERLRFDREKLEVRRAEVQRRDDRVAQRHAARRQAADRKAYAAASKRQAIHDRLRNEQMARAQRIAASPLSALTWSVKSERPPEKRSPTNILMPSSPPAYSSATGCSEPTGSSLSMTKSLFKADEVQRFASFCT